MFFRSFESRKMPFLNYVFFEILEVFLKEYLTLHIPFPPYWDYLALYPKFSVENLQNSVKKLDQYLISEIQDES